MGKVITSEDGIDYWDEPGKEELAIMSNVRWGIIDGDHFSHEPTIGMTVEILAGCADLRLTENQSIKLAVRTGVSDVSKLNGRPCVVVRDSGIIRYIRPHG